MKVIVLFALLAVVAYCDSVNYYFPAINSSFTGLLEAIEARNQANAVKSAERLSKDITEYRKTIPPLDYRRLEQYGYKVTGCDRDLLRLQGESASILSNTRNGRYERIVQEKSRTYDLIKRTLKSCIIAENSIARNFNSNADKPACQEALRRYQERLEQIFAKEGTNTNSYQRDPLLLETYLACSTPIRNN
eukprot:TRINITY_DN8013_c0_g2_i4.p1 TRINITY_DN8013_c0_g2~~TRINITY_DN8013_c0_g2_i4.p1  ORF type:complete len:191 (-),score=45.73 TRINITY_DN8013_c0_g2_i4:154-726(-)